MKTLTLRVDEDTYALLKKAADGEKRTISNFIEYAAYRFVTSEMYVSDEEMDAILDDDNLISGLKKGLTEAKKGKYKIVKE